MKVKLLSLCFVLVTSLTFAQELAQKTHKLPNKLKEIYHFSPGNEQVKEGLYQVVTDRNMAVVSGAYTDNKKTGTWRFFDREGIVLQIYNFSKNEINYEGPDSISNFQYVFDKKVNDTDYVTKPIRIGGRYFGYLPMLNLFKEPEDLTGINGYLINVQLELLISPGGNLADYNIRLVSKRYNLERVLNVNLNVINPEDKTFIPASINHEQVSCRIIIPCRIDENGKLTF